MGVTDPDPTHWTPSGFEQPQRFQVRLFDAAPTLVTDFPVTMNGCDTRQMRVRWRTLHTPIVAGIAPFTDRGRAVVIGTRTPDVRDSGTMWLGSCEQPAFVGPGDIEDLVVEVTVFEPAVDPSVTPATEPPAASGPACSERAARPAIDGSGAVDPGTVYTIPALACDGGWAWGTISNRDFGEARFILSAAGSDWVVVDLGTAICPTRDGMPADVAAKIVPPGEEDCG